MTATETSTTTAPANDEERVLQLCQQLLDELPPKETDPVTFLGRQFDLGLAWVHFPEGYGGLGLSPRLQKTINETLQGEGAPIAATRNVIGHGMGAPTVVTHGSEEQKQRYLRPMFTGEEVWCQLFSEPGAGSDVAGLATRAVLDGEEWILNGQKVWTTLAHLAKWGMIVARSDPDQPKHKGMTYFVVDMEAPGVEVRPLYQITGEAEFNEVYFTDVRIPDAERLGDVGEGWGVSLTTLMNERVAIGGQIPLRGGGFIGELMKIWNQRGIDDPAKKDQLMKLWTAAEVLRLTNIRASQLRMVGTPGPEGSIGKVVSAEVNKRIGEFAVELLGAEGMLFPDGYPMERPKHAMLWKNPQQAFLRARANSIEGGTTEIAKNILGERVLGLPGDVRVDKELPLVEGPAQLTDADFLGLHPGPGPEHFHFTVEDRLARLDGKLYGGTAIAVSIAAAEEVTARSALWMTTQFVSTVELGEEIDVHVEVLAPGKRTNQVRVTGTESSGATVFASVGASGHHAEDGLAGTFEQAPVVSPPDDGEVWETPMAGLVKASGLDVPFATMPLKTGFASVIEMRHAHVLEHPDPGPGRTCVWARRIDGEPVTPALAAFIADMVPMSLAIALGVFAGGMSLDNSIRVGRFTETEWILLDLRPHLAVGGYGHGTGHIWDTDGHLLGTASQTSILRPFNEANRPRWLDRRS